MEIIVKVLTSGKEICLEVKEEDGILYVKNLIFVKLGLEVIHQRLVFKGRTLTDSSRLSDYNIISGSKLHLFEKRSGSASETHKASTSLSTDLWGELSRLLRTHYTDADAELVLQKFKEDFKSGLAGLSLDDLERMAIFKLEEQTE